MKTKRRFGRASNYVARAKSTSRSWGYIPVPGKGGRTTNYAIPEWMFAKDLEAMMGGDAK